jgi:hypothetical protein
MANKFPRKYQCIQSLGYVSTNHSVRQNENTQGEAPFRQIVNRCSNKFYNKIISLNSYLTMALQSLWTLTALSVSQFIYSRKIPWTGDQTVARPLPRRRTTQTQNKRRQTCMPRVGFELTIPAFERAKTVNASDRAATLIGS